MTASFYGLSLAMVVIAFLIALWPLLRAKRYVPLVSSGLLLVAVVIAMYPLASNFKVRSPAFEALSAATSEAEARAAVAALAAELENDDDNYEGWRLLGNGYMELGDFEPAQRAFSQAMQIGGFKDPELKVLLGEAITYGDGQDIPKQAIDLFLAAYKEAPANAKAQWYAGLAFASLNQPNEAALAWEALLSQNPPENVASILRERIAALRGQVAAAPAEDGIAVRVALDDSLTREWPASARLYVSVRNADQPGPPLAARQYAPTSLPITVEMDDRDAMIQGRNISSASNLLITARISMNGDPLGGSGDYVGKLTVERASISDTLTLLIASVSE